MAHTNVLDTICSKPQQTRFTITGHITLNRHLTVTKTRADILCSVCKENEENSFHFLDKCHATMLLRYSLFGAHLPCWTSNSFTVLQFVRTSKGMLHELKKMATTLSQHDLPLLNSDFL